VSAVYTCDASQAVRTEGGEGQGLQSRACCECMAFTLHYIKIIYSGLSKSNFNDHYGDATGGQCLGRIAEISVFSASGENQLKTQFKSAKILTLCRHTTRADARNTCNYNS